MQRRTSSRILYEMLFVCFLLSIYTEVPLFFTGGVFIPSFITVLFILPVLVILFWSTTYKYEAGFIAAVFLVLLLTALASPGFEFISQKFLGLLQTIVSIMSGVLLVKLIGRLNSKRAANILLILSVTLVVGASLEVLGVLRDVSDAFRNIAYAEGDYKVYKAEERDISLTGFPRPNFFTSEPSLLAIGFLVFVNSWLLLSHTKRNYSVALAMTLLLFVLTGSPILVLSAVASTAVGIYSEKRFVGATLVPVVLLAGFLVAMLVSPEVFGNMLARFDRILDIGLNNQFLLSNDSIGVRLALPFIALVTILQSSPLFGVGITGKEVIELYSRLSLPPEFYLVNNLAALFIYLGVVGSLLFVGTFLRYLRRSKLEQITLLIVLVIILSLSMGGFETARFWGYAFLFIGVMKKRTNLRDTEQALRTKGSAKRHHLGQGGWR